MEEGRKGGKGEGEEEEGGREATDVNCRDIVTDIASRCDGFHKFPCVVALQRTIKWKRISMR